MSDSKPQVLHVTLDLGDGMGHTMDLESARALYQELHKLFGKSTPVDTTPWWKEYNPAPAWNGPGNVQLQPLSISAPADDGTGITYTAQSEVL